MTVRNQVPRRMPGYWFESRRRYFVHHHGRRYTALTDLLVILVYPLGRLQYLLRRRPARNAPHFLADFIRHSALFKRDEPLASSPRPRS